jgi:CheY-like chemotaxis protein
MARILIVDDMVTMQRVIQVYLMGQGHDFETANSGLAAIQTMRANPPDLVISDLKMPDIDGAGLCAIMRSDGALTAIPVVMVSASEEGQEAARLAGAAAFVKKPIDMDELQRVVAEVLGIEAGTDDEGSGEGGR